VTKGLFDPEVLDRLEGLNARYGLLTRRIEALQDEAASFDRPPDLGQLNGLESIRRKVKGEVAELLQAILSGLGAPPGTEKDA